MEKEVDDACSSWAFHNSISQERDGKREKERDALICGAFVRQ